MMIRCSRVSIYMKYRGGGGGRNLSGTCQNSSRSVKTMSQKIPAGPKIIIKKNNTRYDKTKNVCIYNYII